MKEITPEIKLRIFAQYLGQVFVYSNEYGNFKEIVEFGYHTEKNIKENAKLLLKDIKNITDTDTRAIAELMGLSQNLLDELQDPRLISAFKLRLPFKIEQNVSVYQYLQLKGYALSYAHYTADDLVTQGIYKLK